MKDYLGSSRKVAWWIQFPAFLSRRLWIPCLTTQNAAQCHTKADSYHLEGISLYTSPIPCHLCETCCYHGTSSKKQRGSFPKISSHTTSLNEPRFHRSNFKLTRNRWDRDDRCLGDQSEYSLVWGHYEQIRIDATISIVQSI
jgi:hypothetical protein